MYDYFTNHNFFLYLLNKNHLHNVESYLLLRSGNVSRTELNGEKEKHIPEIIEYEFLPEGLSNITKSSTLNKMT